jgi:S-methylmethionine-dependent homocysteine/selenocysteine methylase
MYGSLFLLRADSGFCRDDLISWCEENRVEYVFGLAHNRRLITLPTGETLKRAIEAADAATECGPAYYMINCAHPIQFASELPSGDWTRRVRGIRANASRCSHAVLNEAEELDEGDPAELGQDYAALLGRCPWINVLGGCCDTDHWHVEQIWQACKAAA